MPHYHTDPIAKLLTYGECDMLRQDEPWPDYLELGFTQEHVPDLIRMATDTDLNNADGDSLEVWAPLHAWRTLGQLRAEEAIQPLVTLFDKFRDDDWVATELPRVLAMIGPSAIPALQDFLADDNVGSWGRISVPPCLEEIARNHPDHRDECVGVLVRQLEKYATNDPALSGFLVLSLAELKATGGIDLIRDAYSKEYVDLSVLGDIEDVEIMMGLRASRSTPPPRLGFFRDPPGFTSFDDNEGYAGNTPARRRAKTGRNDPCPCGSGKKFKKCCLR